MSLPSTIGHGIAHGALGEGLKPLQTGLGYATNGLFPIQAPSPEEAMDLARRGWISEDNMRAICRMHGIVLDTSAFAGDPNNNPGDALNASWKAVYYAGQELPPQAELREIANRQLWVPGVLEKRLQQYGYYTDSTRQWVANLRYDIPGPADLVRFSVRHFWEPDILKRFGYADEFPGGIIDVWHAMKGLDYPLFTGPFTSQIDQVTGEPGTAARLAATYTDAVGGEPTWAKAYWYSHWILPSPTQGYLMWQRLNPARNRKWDAPEMEGKDFSFEDLQLLLRANDYPPPMRALLAAISHPIPGIRFMRDFVANGVYQYEDIADWANRQGYAPLDAKNIADDVWTSVQTKKQQKADRQCVNLAKAAYLAGILTDQDLTTMLADCGMGADEAAAQTRAIILADQIQRAKQIVASVRSRFVKGKLSAGDAGVLLQQAGIVADAQQRLLTDWGLEQAEIGREATIAQALKWACQGFITLDDFRARAVNLGYAESDITPMIAQVKQCQTTLLARSMAAETKAGQQILRYNQSVIKQAAAAIRQAQRDLASHGSPGKLREWYCQGFLTEGDLFTRLRYLGWPDDDIARLVGDCKGVRDAKLPGLLTPPGG